MISPHRVCTWITNSQTVITTVSTHGNHNVTTRLQHDHYMLKTFSPHAHFNQTLTTRSPRLTTHQNCHHTFAHVHHTFAHVHVAYSDALTTTCIITIASVSPHIQTIITSSVTVTTCRHTHTRLHRTWQLLPCSYHTLTGLSPHIHTFTTSVLSVLMFCYPASCISS